MTRPYLIVAACLCTALCILGARPDLDLDVARLFYVGGHTFVGTSPLGVAIRYAAWSLPFVLLAVMCVATALSRAKVLPPSFAMSARGFVFVVGTLLLGPWLSVHVTLKEHAHRPRPYDVVEFGGRETFRPFDRFDGACRHDCSFPSGETALATWTLAPASLAPPPWRGVAVAGALVFAMATGGWRMALGAHFLSDVCGAMLISLAVVAAGQIVGRALPSPACGRRWRRGAVTDEGGTGRSLPGETQEHAAPSSDPTSSGHLLPQAGEGTRSRP